MISARNYIIMLSISIILMGCGGGKKEMSKTVVASFAAQEWMLRQIAGDSLNVVTLLPPGSDAENYQPSPSTLKAMADADVWFTLSTDGFESSLINTAKSNFADLDIVDCTEGIDKIYGTHEGEDSFDPHILASIRNTAKVAENMTSQLCELYPGMSEYLKERSASLVESLKEKDDAISRMNIEGGKFAVRHPSLSYFARDYGLVQLPLEIEGKEVTPKQLMQRMEEIKSQRPTVFVIDAKHATDRDKDMADELQMIPLVVMLDDASWIQSLERIATHICNEADRAE